MAEPSPPARRPLATYANYCEVGHNAYEFLVDYGQVRPEGDGIDIHTRIVAGPVPAKIFLRLLSEAVARFEAAHGPILVPEASDPLALLLAASPDFEERAMRARQRPASPPASRHDPDRR